MESFKERGYRLLRRSEQYFRTDMVYLARSGFWTVFGQLFVSILSFGLVLVAARYLPKETYGTYRYLLSLGAILGVFTLTGMNRAVSQAVSVGHEGALKIAVNYQLKWNFLSLAAFWALGGYYFLHGNATLGLGLVIMGLFWPLTTAFNTYGAYLEGKREFKLNNFFSIGATFLYVAGMIVAIIFSGSLIWLVTVYSVATFLSTLIPYLYVLRAFKPHGSAGEVLTYGRKLTFIGVLAPVVSQVDSVILAHYWGVADLAIYSLALAIPSRAISYIKSWVDIGFPKLANRTPEEIGVHFWKRIFQGISAGALCTVAYVAVAPFVFTHFIPTYLESVRYSQILALNFMFAMPNRYMGILFESQKLSRLLFANSLIQNGMRLLLYVVFGFWGGIMGLVFAQVVYSFLSLLINITLWYGRGIFYRAASA